MEAIADNVYIEDKYVGVTLGVITQPRGLIQIDAPPSPEDGRTWRASMMGMGSGPERVLINLDAHPDRTLGVRAMDCTVIAHEKTALAFRNRPNTFKAQGDETGSQLLFCGNREGEMENRTFSRLTLHPDLPAMPQHGEATECQPNPQPAGFVGAAQACKFIKNTILFRRWNPGAVIPDPDMYPLIFVLRASLDVPTGGCKFDGIFHQVDQHTPRHVCIHPDGRECLRQFR